MSKKEQQEYANLVYQWILEQRADESCGADERKDIKIDKSESKDNRDEALKQLLACLRVKAKEPVAKAETHTEKQAEPEAEKKTAENSKTSTNTISKVYLVDTENISSEYTAQLLNNQKIMGTAEVHLLFTQNTGKMSYQMLYDALHYPGQVFAEKCEVGKNALDFQIVAYVGSICNRWSNAEYIILSNDHGYDAAIHLLKAKGINIKRNAVQKKVVNKPVDPDLGKAQKFISAKNWDKAYGIKAESLAQVIKKCRANSNDKRGSIVCSAFGATTGHSMFRSLSKGEKDQLFS